MSEYTLTLGDCLDPVTGLASLADKSVDNVIADPPYEAEAHTLQRRIKSAGTNGVVRTEPLDFSPITSDTREAVATQMTRVARRWILVFCQAEAVGPWRDVLSAAGAVYKRPCVWVKTDGMPQLTGDRPGMGYESIVTAHAPGRSQWNGGGTLGVFQFSKSDSDGSHTSRHPTQKPLALMERLVSLFTNHGETICDPFAGSGTTGVAALRLGRKFIGWELDPKYHAIAAHRLESTREQGDLFRGLNRKAKQETLGGVLEATPKTERCGGRKS